jgi:hypothetical protein
MPRKELQMNDNEIVQILQKANEAIETLQGAYEVMSALADVRKEEIESLQAQLAETQRRERAAVEMLIKFIKQSDDACDYCKNHIECAGEQCEEFEKGVGGTGNDGTEFPDWHWQCTDFDYGTCAMLANTPCNGCFENDCSGFEWLAYRTKPERSEG